MRYLANCNRVLHDEDILLKDELGNIRYSLKHVFLKKFSGLRVYNDMKNQVYHINYNPLKFTNRYIISDNLNQEIIKISIGKKLLHIIEYKNKHYICKGSFLKMKYRLYQYDDELSSIQVIKKDKLRYFEIIQEDEVDPILALCMLIVAQTIKDRVWFIYGA